MLRMNDDLLKNYVIAKGFISGFNCTICKS